MVFAVTVSVAVYVVVLIAAVFPVALYVAATVSFTSSAWALAVYVVTWLSAVVDLTSASAAAAAAADAASASAS